MQFIVDWLNSPTERPLRLRDTHLPPWHCTVGSSAPLSSSTQGCCGLYDYLCGQEPVPWACLSVPAGYWTWRGLPACYTDKALSRRALSRLLRMHPVTARDLMYDCSSLKLSWLLVLLLTLWLMLPDTYRCPERHTNWVHLQLSFLQIWHAACINDDWARLPVCHGKEIPAGLAFAAL